MFLDWPMSDAKRLKYVKVNFATNEVLSIMPMDLLYISCAPCHFAFETKGRYLPKWHTALWTVF